MPYLGESREAYAVDSVGVDRVEVQYVFVPAWLPQRVGSWKVTGGDTLTAWLH